MKSKVIVVAVLMSIFSSAASAQQNGRQASKYGWRLDYRAAKSLAQKTGKPMMVVFRCVP